MDSRVLIVGENHQASKIITFFLYPTDSKALPLVIPFSLVIVMAFISEGLQKLIVPYQFPVTHKVINAPLITQVSIYYMEDEYLDRINDIIKELFSR